MSGPAFSELKRVSALASVLVGLAQALVKYVRTQFEPAYRCIRQLEEVVPWQIDADVCQVRGGGWGSGAGWEGAGWGAGLLGAERGWGGNGDEGEKAMTDRRQVC